MYCLFLNLWQFHSFHEKGHRFMSRSNTPELQMNEYGTCCHLYGKERSGGPWGMLVGPLVPTGTLLCSTSEMEIGVEPVHRERLWRLTSISPVTLSADTLRNIQGICFHGDCTGGVDWLQLSHSRRKNNILERFVMHCICYILKAGSGRRRVKDSKSTWSGC